MKQNRRHPSLIKINFISLFAGEELWLKEHPQWVKDKNEHI